MAEKEVTPHTPYSKLSCPARYIQVKIVIELSSLHSMVQWSLP